MKKIKNLLLTVCIICFFSTLLNLIFFLDGLTKPQNVLAIFIIYYILEVLACLVCGIAFLLLYKMPKHKLFKSNTLFKTFCIISICCSLLGGVLALYAYYLYCLQLQTNIKNGNINNSIEINGMEIIEDKRMAKYIDDVNRLEEMKKSGTISQEECERLKKKIFQNYIKGE